MTYTQVELAEMIARHAHRGVTDKVGMPYIEHPQRLAEAAGNIWQVEAAAWLHDVVEDTHFTLDDLRSLNVDESVVVAVDHLTKRGGESRADYVARAMSNPIALHVKKLDNADNSSPYRIQLLKPEDRVRLVAKYQRDRDQLYGG